MKLHTDLHTVLIMSAWQDRIIDKYHFENNKTDQINQTKHPPISSQLGVVKDRKKINEDIRLKHENMKI